MGTGTGGCGGNGSGKFFAALTGELLAFAQFELHLSQRLSDGVTAREHYDNVRRQTGETPERLAEGEANPCPEVLRYLWDMFCALGIRRRYDPQTGVPEPISASELRDWLFLRGYDLRPWEVEALDGLERLMRSTVMIKAK